MDFTLRWMEIRENDSMRLRSLARRLSGDLTACAALLLVAFTISCLHVSITGTLFPDGPQYANAGAMIHDWLRSGEWLHPYTFAQRDYSQYPAFHLPFHPPVYPGLLSLFFLLTGTSYTAARVFIALCFGTAGCFFYGIQRRLGAGRIVALSCGLLLLTTPELARWGRDTMSEVPALALILAASYLFIAWLKSDNPLYCLAAFVLAEMAFLSRVTSAGVLPAWFLFALLTGRFRRLLTRLVISMSAIYLIVNIAWAKFVSGYAKYETFGDNSTGSADHSFEGVLSLDQIGFYIKRLPAIAGWCLTLTALIGLVYSLYTLWRSKKLTSSMEKFPPNSQPAQGAFWVAWMISNGVFLWLLQLVPEERYFFFVLPAFAGLVASLLDQNMVKAARAGLAFAVLGACLITNIAQIKKLPRGVIGYQPVAERIARLGESGNILSATWISQDFIFRYRVLHPEIRRSVIRGDRTLAIRVAKFGGFSNRTVEPVILAHSTGDVLNTIQRGRIRYLITCTPSEGQLDDRDEEMILAHEAVRSLPAQFALIEEFPLLIEFDTGRASRGRVFLWKFLGELPPGPSELPVIVPTADMVINPAK